MTKRITKKINKKMNKNTRSKSSTRSRRLSKSKNMNGGGEDGSFVLPPSYFGGNTNGYYAEGSPELSNSTGQHASSQGVIWDNGQYAGPNLYPSMKGGGCGCDGKRNRNSKSRKSKSRNSKSKVNRRH